MKSTRHAYIGLKVDPHRQERNIFLRRKETYHLNRYSLSRPALGNHLSEDQRLVTLHLAKTTEQCSYAVFSVRTVSELLFHITRQFSALCFTALSCPL